MEKLLADYQALYRTIVCRIYMLKKQLENDTLRTMEYERLQARHDMLEKERWEIVDAMNEMRKHL